MSQGLPEIFLQLIKHDNGSLTGKVSCEDNGRRFETTIFLSCCDLKTCTTQEIFNFMLTFKVRQASREILKSVAKWREAPKC